jgi:hypothetical protein
MRTRNFEIRASSAVSLACSPHPKLPNKTVNTICATAIGDLRDEQEMRGCFVSIVKSMSINGHGRGVPVAVQR